MTGESTKKLARRLNARQFDAYSQEPPTRPEWTAARAALVAVSIAMMLLVVIAAVAGVWLVLRNFPSMSIFPGALLLAIAWTLRPRVGRIGTDWAVVTRDDAPALFALLDQVATATGAPVPHHVALDYEFNASAGIFGLQRKRRLLLGLPLWGILRPQQRVALLAHEFGHFVNGDPSRRLLVKSALVTPGAIAELLEPSTSLTTYRPLMEIIEAVLRPVQRLLAWLFVQLQVWLLAVVCRDRQRAEYCADAMSVRLAGTEATVALLEDMVIGDQLHGAVNTVERGIHSNPKTARNHPGVAPWRAAADQTRSQLDLPALLEKSIEEDASLWSEHPPSGLRARIAESWPHAEPSLVLSQEDSDKIDDELKRWYAKAGRDLVWS